MTYIDAVHPLVGVFDGFLVHSRGATGSGLRQAPLVPIAAARPPAPLRAPGHPRSLPDPRSVILDLASKKFGGDPRRFGLAAPTEFARLSHAAFMGQAEPPDEPIMLPKVEPFQISLVSKDTTKASGPDGKNSSDSDPVNPVAPIIPPEPPQVPARDGREVVVRYVSSMLLLQDLFKSGQTDQLRRYLFDFARFEWDRQTYLKEFERAFNGQRDEVEAQIAAFDKDLESFNRSVEAYNTAVRRFNEGEGGSVLETPKEPAIPAALPVPAILSNPRTPEQLSRSAFREEALTRHLRVPERLSVGPAP